MRMPFSYVYFFRAVSIFYLLCHKLNIGPLILKVLHYSLNALKIDDVQLFSNKISKFFAFSANIPPNVSPKSLSSPIIANL